MTVLDNPWIPQRCRDRLTQKQAQFLAYEGKEALFGGSAGGGKSFALLMAALQYIDEPGYHALILRRTFKQLDKPDSIMSTSREWLAGTGAVWNEQKHQWRFPGGQTLTFGHMESGSAIYDYQGSAYAFVAFDELTQFEEGMYRYLFSRIRRPEGSKVPMRMRAASNPGGIGHLWCKQRFITPAPTADRVFIPARLDDNPNLDRAAYLESLAELDPITRAQLLAGDWDAHQGGRFLAEWLRKTYTTNTGRQFGPGGEYVLGAARWPAESVWRFQTCDPAASAEDVSKRGHDPDYSVVSTWGVTPNYDLLWLDCERFRLEVPDIVAHVQGCYSQWRPQYIAIEAVAANNAVYKYAARTSMVVKQVSPGGRDKLVRATPAMTLAQSGRLWLPERAHWLEDVRAELLQFTGDDRRDAHDDVVDTLSYACSCLEEHDDGAAGRPFAVGSRGW